DVVVIGASAGGLQPLRQLVAGLPRHLRAAVLVVLHSSSEGLGLLPQVLAKVGHLPAKHPTDREAIRHGQIYVAPPDRHMLLVRGGVVSLTRGPRENGFRPAVDPLFRTAARTFGARTVGVVLSGALDDGTRGLLQIKQAGGVAIVQDPSEATVGG